MLRVDIRKIAQAIHGGFPSDIMKNGNNDDRQFAKGATSACGVIARYLAHEILEQNPDFDARQFLKSCGVDPDTF